MSENITHRCLGWESVPWIRTLLWTSVVSDDLAAPHPVPFFLSLSFFSLFFGLEAGGSSNTRERTFLIYYVSRAGAWNLSAESASARTCRESERERGREREGERERLQYCMSMMRNEYAQGLTYTYLCWSRSLVVILVVTV